jgi:hypothetical protein
MTDLNTQQINSGTINNFFAPPSGKNATQIATPAQLQAQSEAKNVRPSGTNILTGLIVQSTLSGSPAELQANAPQPVITPTTLQKKVYSGLYYCVEKMSRYMQAKLQNFYDPSGAYIQNAINSPQNAAVRSATNPGADLTNLYNAQFGVLYGPKSTNTFIASFSQPLPNALTQGQFVQELTPSSAAASAQAWLLRAGIDETGDTPVAGMIDPTLSTPSNTQNNMTPLQAACLQKT